jgi:hypothetical protein
MSISFGFQCQISYKYYLFYATREERNASTSTFIAQNLMMMISTYDINKTDITGLITKIKAINKKNKIIFTITTIEGNNVYFKSNNAELDELLSETFAAPQYKIVVPMHNERQLFEKYLKYLKINTMFAKRSCLRFNEFNIPVK